MRAIKRLSIIVLVIIFLLIGYWAITAYSAPQWTGFGPYDEKVNGPRAKTLWDWLDLLIVPIVLAAGAWWLNRSEKEAEQRATDQRVTTEREIAIDRQRQTTLETYFDRMTDLILNRNLRESKEGDEVRIIARTHTLTALRNLDGRRKGEVLRFLHESYLIWRTPVVDLAEADLDDIDLRSANLMEAILERTSLKSAKLNKANLRGANLWRADLLNADINDAALYRANLSEANLAGTNLSEAKLSGADLVGANLSQANLSKAVFWSPATENGHGEANMIGANLLEANLTGARINSKQLKDIESLDGATMQDGTPFDLWKKNITQLQTDPEAG